MTFKTLRDFDLTGKTVLLRADLNVPAKNGKVTDTTRIDRLKPTIDYLVTHSAKTLILSHFGRPKGAPDPEFSLKFLIPALEKSWGHKVAFEKGDGKLVLLENTRFNKGEESNDPTYARALAAQGDIFINDAFSAAHRAHASTEGLAHLLPCGAGFLMEAELNALSAALEKPRRPVAALVGGAKISTKLELLGNLVTKVDMLVLGGGMANTFWAARGADLKKSLCEHDMLDAARTIEAKAKDSGCEIILPVDGVAATAFAAHAPHVTCAMTDVPDGHMVLDIGPETIDLLKQKLTTCKTIVWNGPLGAFEIEPFNAGTVALARFVASRKNEITSVAGGGDTVAALEQAGVVDDFTYISTAGGAFLEWLEGKTLPGVAALQTKEKAT